MILQPPVSILINSMTRKSPRPKALWTKLRGGLKPRTLKKRTPKKVKKVTHIKIRSKVMRGKMAYYNIRKRVFLEARPQCEACHRLADAITSSYPIRKAPHPAADIHHIRGRAGKLLLDERYWIGVCRNAHNLIHANQEIARKAGLLAQRGEWGKQP